MLADDTHPQHRAVRSPGRARTRSGGHDVVLEILLSREWNAWLAEEAEREGRTAAAIVLQALTSYRAELDVMNEVLGWKKKGRRRPLGGPDSKPRGPSRR